MDQGTVVIVPGLAGSTLNVDFVAIGLRHIWLDYSALAGSAVRALELAEDGVSPESPSVVNLVEFGPALSSYYQTARDYFEQYLPTKMAGYDWRLDLSGIGSDFADDLRPLLKEGPVYLVCHSMGGLVARRAEALLRGDSHYQNLKRIYLLGTPNYGSWAAVQALAGISYWFAPYIRVMASVAGFWTASVAKDFLRRAISHFTSIQELMPDPFHGPYATDPNVMPLYQLDTWSAYNPNMVQILLDKAKTFRAELSAPPDGNLYATVTGIGFPTIRDVFGIHRLDDPKDYVFADDGDGVVWAPACRIPGVNGATIFEEHTALMTNIKVFDFIRDTMCCGVPADVVLT